MMFLSLLKIQQWGSTRRRQTATARWLHSCGKTKSYIYKGCDFMLSLILQLSMRAGSIPVSDTKTLKRHLHSAPRLHLFNHVFLFSEPYENTACWQWRSRAYLFQRAQKHSHSLPEYSMDLVGSAYLLQLLKFISPNEEKDLKCFIRLVFVIFFLRMSYLLKNKMNNYLFSFCNCLPSQGLTWFWY